MTLFVQIKNWRNQKDLFPTLLEARIVVFPLRWLRTVSTQLEGHSRDSSLFPAQGNLAIYRGEEVRLASFLLDRSLGLVDNIRHKTS